MYRSHIWFFVLLSAALVLVPAYSCKRGNRAPEAPTAPEGHAYCAKDTTYAYRAVVIDPDGDSVSLRFDWGDGTLSEWSGWFDSGETTALTHAWTDTGAYEVRAWAQDQEHLASGFSAPLFVTVHLSPDVPAQPSGPDQGAQDSAYTFASVAYHPEGIAVAIRFAWGDGDTAEWSTFVAPGESVRASHAWTDTGTYLVTAQARDTSTGRSQWSSAQAISVHPPDTLIKWRVHLDASLRAAPAIDPDGTIYIGSADSSLYALKPDGTFKWSYETEGHVISSPAIADDGAVCFCSDDRYIYCVNAHGTLRWRYLLACSVTSAPAVADDGTVYVGSDGRYLHAFTPDGALKWFFLTDAVVKASPAVAADGTIYIGAADFFAVNPDSTLKWRYHTAGNAQSSPAIAADGTVYFGSTDGYLYALNPDGTLKWRCQTGGNIESSPAIAADSTVYIGSTDNFFYALNTNGTLKWRYETQAPVHGPPAVATDGTVYFGSDDNALYALYHDGTLKWRYETGENVEAAATIGPDGTIYFVSFDGYLYALRGTSPLADSPWPKAYHDIKNTGRVGGGK